MSNAWQREPERKIVSTNLGDAMTKAKPPVKMPTENEANHMILGWNNEGLDYEAIAKRLEATGYVSAQTGAPLGVHAIPYRLRKLGAGGKRRKKKYTKRAAAVERPAKPAVDRRLGAVKVILALSEYSAEERIDMALAVIG